MCAPERPASDAYDDHAKVEPHFKPTPDLTAIPAKHAYGRQACIIKHLLRNVYMKYDIQICEHFGLYYAGTEEWLAKPDHDKTMLMVFELQKDELEEWRKVDARLREILHGQGLSGRHGVCLRYYEYEIPVIMGISPPASPQLQSQALYLPPVRPTQVLPRPVEPRTRSPYPFDHREGNFGPLPSTPRLRPTPARRLAEVARFEGVFPSTRSLLAARESEGEESASENENRRDGDDEDEDEADADGMSVSSLASALPAQNTREIRAARQIAIDRAVREHTRLHEYDVAPPAYGSVTGQPLTRSPNYRRLESYPRPRPGGPNWFDESSDSGDDSDDERISESGRRARSPARSPAREPPVPLSPPPRYSSRTRSGINPFANADYRLLADIYMNQRGVPIDELIVRTLGGSLREE